MVTADHDRRFYRSLLYEVIDSQPKLCTLLVAKPAYPRRQSLELDPLASKLDPLRQDAVFGKHLKHQVIGHMNVARVARERHPAERTATFAEQRADICRN